ncbi:hypothetical protein N7526_005786 [Penicillium atrosanguineum]|nr:hypothetical protein N7526_005786 [Penicillium atrosanguineum]
METQDSIDIATLQRDALGLEHKPSQSFFPGHSRIDHTAQQQPRSNKAADRSHGHTSAGTGYSATSISDSARATPKHPRPSPSPQYAQNPMNSNPTANEPIQANPVQTTQSGTMDSGETAPGDTQVVSQSVYDSIIRQNGESVYQSHSQTGADGATLMTLHEGDSGHLDLLADFNSAHLPKNDSADNDEESNYDGSESSPMAPLEYQPEFFPESQRFLTATPGTAVKRVQTPGTSIKTPSLSRNPLVGDLESSGGLMGLSQLFKATQAPSSPLVDGLQPDIVSDRPSPNLPIQHQRVINNVSSPLVHSRVLFARESSEPNLNYISLKESQSRRDKSLGERLTRSADNMDDEIDKEFYKESSFVERARRQRELDDEAAAQFATLDALPRPKSVVTSSPGNPILEVHEDDPMPDAAGSEEETEQEEDLGPQVLQSQEAPQSSEEDKENYNGPQVSVEAASSAHNRLSQALTMEENLSTRMNIMADPEIIHFQQSAILEDSDQYIGRSSQVMVKDSQQSPQPSATPKQNDHHIADRPAPYEIKVDPTSDVDGLSPARRALHSSPPASRSGSRPVSRHHSISPIKSTNFAHPSVLQSGQNASSTENQRVNSSNPSEQGISASFLTRAGSGNGEKSSSLPSRVTETPVHLRPQNNDIGRLTSIPETSPRRTAPNEWEGQSNGDGLNEDDDLPPIRASQLRPSQTRALSSPIKNIQSQALPQVLSSPSGRQRRKLTDIASDLSPQIQLKFGDFGNFFTADDEAYHELVSEGSPTRPKKKRRGNAGQNFLISDSTLTSLPSTPRAQPAKTVARIPEWPTPREPQSPAAIHVPATMNRKEPRPSRSSENVWEIGASPQQVIHRRSKAKLIRTTLSPKKDESRAFMQKPEIDAPARSVMDQRNQPVPSSELTDVDIEPDLAQSDATTFQSSPTKPPSGVPDDSQIAPSQVLAVWMGQKRAYYPATCFGTPLGVSSNKYSVKFEDSLPVEVVKGAVKRFELRVGDGVKVDMRGVPKVTHIVRGFDDKLTKEELAQAAETGFYPQTDIYGHTTVILGPKQPKSLPDAGLPSSENVIKVPIARIYLDMILWNQLKDRAFKYQQPQLAPRETKSHTPSEKSSLPASPSTRISRSIYESTGIFAGMAFAVSYKEDEVSKNRVTRLIMENGGTVLHEGFTELFESSSIRPVDTPTKSGDGDDTTAASVGLRLNGLAENVGFACLIADTHSRREKYMQALALNLPCLSGRWVEDCVAKGRVLDWDIYLLPAGDSMFLNGATKSRVMVPISPSETRLVDTISARPKMLDGKSVLIVMGRGKAEEKRKAYIFLTFALGASRVERVPDLETAKALLDSQSEASLPPTWDMIYVDDADQAAAKALLVPPPRTQRIHLFHGRKRKKSAVFTTSATLEASSSTTVIGSEFVCQSLILGRIFGE